MRVVTCVPKDFSTRVTHVISLHVRAQALSLDVEACLYGEAGGCSALSGEAEGVRADDGLPDAVGLGDVCVPVDPDGDVLEGGNLVIKAAGIGWIERTIRKARIEP